LSKDAFGYRRYDTTRYLTSSGSIDAGDGSALHADPMSTFAFASAVALTVVSKNRARPLYENNHAYDR